MQRKETAMAKKKVRKNSISSTKLYTFVWLGLTILLFLVVAQWSNAPSIPLEGATAVLTLIGTVAVGIERTIEASWDGVSLFRGKAWAKAALDQLEKFTQDLNEQMAPFHTRFEEAMAKIEQEYAKDKAKLEDAKKALETVQAQISQFQTIAPNIESINKAAAQANTAIAAVQGKYPEVDQVCTVGQVLINATTDFGASFKDNPGRRLISLMLGMFLGLCIVGPLWLDIFLAALGTTLPDSNLLPHAGVAITGLVIGLGSGPTHTLIRTLEEIKNKRQAANG